MSVNLDKLPQVVETLVQLGACKVILFGSAANAPQQARDIDLAVAGIPLQQILDADVAVGDILQQPYDLISWEENPRLFDIVARYGRVLYG